MKPDLDQARQSYAEELRTIGALRSNRVVDAFASVPREAYLGPGPWRIPRPNVGYVDTDDDDPGHIYHNVLVAIDEARGLNNGQPIALAKWMDAVDVQSGDHVVHIGCGTGYYSAIFAEIVGDEGRVTAIEIDPGLAERAAKNLMQIAHVDAVCQDGSKQIPSPADVIFVNAGASHPLPGWLDALAPGGRLMLPLTVQPTRSLRYAIGAIRAWRKARSLANLPVHGAARGSWLALRRLISAPHHGAGGMLLVTNVEHGYAARFVSRVGIYSCAGARDDARNDRLAKAYGKGFEDLAGVCSLRRDGHVETDECWLHDEAFCLSARPV